MPGIMSDEGDLLLTSLRPRSRSSSSPGQQSLLAAMNKFVAAVEEMDGAIMIPCKLQDMSLENPPCLPRSSSSSSSTPNGTTTASTNPSSNSQENGRALVPLDDHTTVNNHNKPNSDPKNTNLYTYYCMLRAIKGELVRGPSEENEEEEEERTGKEEEDDIAKQTATMFRHHLRGLFDVLRQMTGTANVLTAKYQSEIGDSSLSSTRNLSHFTL